MSIFSSAATKIAGLLIVFSVCFSLSVIFLEQFSSLKRSREKTVSPREHPSSFTAEEETPKVCSVDLSIALECLHQTTPSLVLEYPDDAIEHFNEIRKALLPWAQSNNGTHHYHSGAGFDGPWIENYWISHFETMWDESSNNDANACLSDYFGPFIPIFVPWVDHWIKNGRHYPDGLVTTFLSVLRPNVPYVTVSKSAPGLPGKGEFEMHSIPNLLVLSSGGYGHVPIPLLKQDEDRCNDLDVSRRTFDVSYVGSLGHAPRHMREKIHNDTLAITELSTMTYEYYYGEDWKQVMRNSRLSLVPRGFGRTAYHLMETLQMGLVPIYVYLKSDLPWIPYADLFHEVGYITDSGSYPEFVKNILQNVTMDEIRHREQRIVSLRTSHFSHQGTMEQIGLFLIGEKNDLRCRELPRTQFG
jgi:hypothetical protein